MSSTVTHSKTVTIDCTSCRNKQRHYRNKRHFKILRGRKVFGVDNISNEQLKYGGDALIEEILLLIKLIFKRQEIPEKIKSNLTIATFKNDKQDPNNPPQLSIKNDNEDNS